MDSLQQTLDATGCDGALLDAFPQNIAVIGADGRIILVNDAWNRFAQQNGAPHDNYANSNYFAVCKRSIKGGDELAALALSGIKEVSTGARDHFDLEYPCHSPEVKRWFRMRVARLRHNCGFVIVLHKDITDYKMVESQLQDVIEKYELQESEAKTAGAALRTILSHIEDDRREIEHRINLNRQRIINPLLNMLLRRVDSRHRRTIALAQEFVNNISSPFLKTLVDRFPNLTPTDLRICTMIYSGLSSREIADIHVVSIEAVHKSRQRLRHKLGISHETIDTLEFLKSIKPV